MVERNIAGVFRISIGDVEKGFKESHHIREDRFVINASSHAALEPHATVARYDHTQNKLDVWTGNMGIEIKRFWLAKAIGVPLTKVRLHHVYIGGSFGGTKPVVQPYDIIACLLSKRTGRSVKIVLSREEVFLACKSCHRMISDLKTGIKTVGRIVAQRMKIINDPGAYRGSSPIPIYLSYAFSSPIFDIPNWEVDGVAVYTNNPCCMAKRGHGVPQARCAIDSHLDMIARDLGLDSVEMALKNIRKKGDRLPNGDRLDSYGLKECIEKAAEAIHWKEKRGKPGNRGVGLGLSAMFSGTAFYPFASSAIVKVNQDGRITLYQGSSEFGQGAETALSQIAAEELGVCLEDVDIVAGDTEECPVDFGNCFSGGIYVSGQAVRKASIDAKRQLFENVSQVLEVRVEDLEIREGRISVKGSPKIGMPLGEVVRDAIQRCGGNPIIGRGYCKAVPEVEFYPSISKGAGRLTDAYGLAATTAEVEVDTETGKVKVLKIVTADDCGFEINPLAVQVQLESQQVMGIGDALFEEILCEEGKIINPNFNDYRIPGILDIPELECIPVQTLEPKGPYGAKEVGEGARASVAPAIANAITDAIGVRIKEFPITPEKILKALEDKKS
jgi:4-hydroxybenzoyl-CoA reductase subunit alpha